MATLRQSKDSLIKLQEYVGQFIRVKFQGGREVTGVLKSIDNSLNMILDDCQEGIRDQNDPYIITSEKRVLGLVVVRGSLISCIYPMNDCEVIENPFQIQNEDD